MTIEEYVDKLGSYINTINNLNNITYYERNKLTSSIRKHIAFICDNTDIRNALRNVSVAQSLNDIFHSNFKYIKHGE